MHSGGSARWSEKTPLHCIVTATPLLTNWVFVVEPQAQPEGLVVVYRVVVQDFHIHGPFLEIIRSDKLDAWGEVFSDLIAETVKD